MVRGGRAGIADLTRRIVVYPFIGLRLSPLIAAGAMALSSLSVVTNANRLRRFGAQRLAQEGRRRAKPQVEVGAMTSGRFASAGGSVRQSARAVSTRESSEDTSGVLSAPGQPGPQSGRLGRDVDQLHRHGWPPTT